MKKLFILSFALFSILTAKAATQAYTITSGGVSNISTAPIIVRQIIQTGTNVTVPVTTWFFDLSSPVMTNIVGGYSNLTTFPTNLVTSYVNYFGLTNNLTNLVIMEMTNAVSAVTNTAFPKLQVSAVGTTPNVLSAVNYYFFNGLTVTNSGTGTAVISLTTAPMNQ